MNERRPGFAPKIRQGEKAPVAPEGTEITRVNGRLYAVPEKGNDSYSGGSAYTKRQSDAIVVISRNNPVIKGSSNKSAGAW